jgi:hypothetical protein
MAQWSVIDAGQLVPKDLVSAVRGASGLATGALEALGADIDAVASLPPLPDLPDPRAAAAEAIVATLDALAAGTKVHVAVIPISKVIPDPAPPRAPATVDDLQAWLDVRLGPAAGTAEAYQALVAGVGGNAGFYRAFLESLFDAGDPNRPQFFGQSDAVTMTVIMSGAASYASVAHAASVIDQLIRPPGSGGGSGGRVIPVPQGVSARPVAAAAGGRIAVQVSWDPPQGVITLPYFPGLSMAVRRYAVIRMTSPRATSVRGVLDLFQTQALVEGMTARDAKVVAVGSGLNSRFLDSDPPTDPSAPLYYCVAWEVDVVEPSGTVTMPFDQVSGVVKVAAIAPPPTPTGSPPDWRTVASALDTFPGLSNLVRGVLAQLDTLVGGSPSPTSRLASAMKQASDMAQRLSARASDLLADVDRLQASLSRPLPSLHAIQLTSGTGGNAFLAAELARRLGDLSDPGRPPFDSGEYVCGVCAVAGAPRLADLAPVIDLFGSLVGPADQDNPLVSVLTAIDTVVTQEEATVFDPGLRPIAGPASRAVDPLTGRPPATVAPVISASGIPVASDDAANPNQGDTNVTPVSALC